MGIKESLIDATLRLANLSYDIKFNKISKEGLIEEVNRLRDNLKEIKDAPTLNDNSSNVCRFQSITDEMTKTYIKKNHDYGDSFSKSLDSFGLVASAVRIGDKMNRFDSLTRRKAMVQDESIRDTLLDMAAYAIMTAMWLDEKKNDIV